MENGQKDLPDFEVPLQNYKGTKIFKATEVEEIQRMEVREDDTWVLSFPRSGTTLTQEIVYLIQTNLDFKRAKNMQLDERFPFLDLHLPNMEHFRGIKFIEKMESPRLIKSHLHRHILPKDIFDKKCKVIYVMRNPKDVMVSCYFLTKYLRQYNPVYTIEDYCRQWVNGETYATPWWRHVRDFWIHRNEGNILFLRYEDIVKNLEETIRRIGRYLEKDLTEEQVRQISVHCQFRSMKNNDTVNATWQDKQRVVDRSDGGHIRKGKVGNWIEHFTPEMNKLMDDMIEENLSGTGLTFDYGDVEKS